jgi:hypothetical protein
MAFPQTGILDSFVRANEMPLNQTNWYDLIGVIVSGNQAKASAYDSYSGLSFYDTSFGPDCDAYVTIPTIDLGIQNQARVLARYDPDAENGYSVNASYLGGGGSDEIELDRWDGGGNTPLAIYAVTLADGDAIGIRCEGNNISAYHYTLGAWALLGTQVDATYPGAGLCGLFVTANATTTDSIALENFGAGNETGAAFPEPGVIDNFNRANEGPPPSSAWVDQFVMGVVGNEGAARQASTNNYDAPAVWRTVFPANQESYVEIVTRQDDTMVQTVLARYQDASNYVAIATSRDDGAGDTISIGEVVSGAGATIGGPYTIIYQDGDSIGIRCVGTTIEAWYKPVAGAWGQLGIGTTTLPPAPGYVGLVVYGTTTRLSGFGGGAYVAPNNTTTDPCIECARLGNPFAPPAELDWYIAPDGQSYQFDNARDDILLAFQGYGMPGINYISQQGPFQHGETLLDYRLAPRVIQLEHRRQGCDRYDYWDNRGGILNILRPNRQLPNSFELGKLRKVLPGNVKRDIDVLVQQGPQFAARNDGGDWLDFTDTIQFIAPDPTFYDPDTITVIWAVTDTGGLKFYSAFALDELKSPWVFGTDVVTGSVQVHYNGTWLAYPTIYFVGPLNSPMIENQTTGETIQLSYNIPAGETVTVALPFGNKTVKSNTGANLIGYVTTGSDLATFHIAPEPEANWCGTPPRPCGLNTFSVSGGAGVIGQTQIRMTYNVRFIGI